MGGKVLQVFVWEVENCGMLYGRDRIIRLCMGGKEL